MLLSMHEPTDFVRKPSSREGVLAVEHFGYRGKHYQVPIFDPVDPVLLTATKTAVPVPAQEPVIQKLNTPFDIAEFARSHRPVSLGVLSPSELDVFTTRDAVRVLDLPIKLPDDATYRLPRALAQFAPTVQRIIDFEHTANAEHAEYFAYLTIDQRHVAPHTLHREAPCHVDGFQGARWAPKCRINHSYTVSDVLPTAYYVQPFDFARLHEAKHDFFWEMNAQVADTNEVHRWQPQPGELTLMDAYCVHRGVENESDAPVFRTWLRLSFEERRRVFDRLGNAHNPLFTYDWKMVDRDIEQLGLVAFRQSGDASLRVFPWQGLDGKPLPPGAPKTRPGLKKIR
jgi:hypothetical protein